MGGVIIAKANQKAKEEIIEVSKVFYGGNLYEQIYDPEKKISCYLGWDDKEEELLKLDEIEHAPRRYIPINDDLLKNGAVILPSDAIDYGTVEDLEFDISTFIEVWVDVSKEHLQKGTWYTMLTWNFDKLHTIPYLSALGDYGTGKTRYLDVIGGVCYKPMFVGGSVRPAPIYRVIDLWRGTAIFDEFTLSRSDESQDIIQIFNNGFQRGKPVLRCDANNYDKVKSFDPFCPKLISRRKRFKDRALESRCITEIMRETSRSDVPIDLTSDFFKQRSELQNKLLMYRFKNWNKINPDESIHIDFGNVLPRIKQAFIPFTVLFQHDENRLNEFIKYTQEHNQKTIEENSMSFDGQIFNHYIKLLEEHDESQQHLDDYKEPVITSSKIRVSMIESGWKEDSIISATIGKRLSVLGFESKSKKIEGKTVRSLEIDEDLLKSLKARYLVTAVTEVTGYTQVTGEDKDV